LFVAPLLPRRNGASIAMSAESCAWIGVKFGRTGERFVETFDYVIVTNFELIGVTCGRTCVIFGEIVVGRVGIKSQLDRITGLSGFAR
jgi:hypothetical protein